MTIERYAKLYGKEYFEQFANHGSYFENDQIKRSFRLLAKHLKHRLGGTTHLDVGCAAGFLVQSMRDEGYESVGVDLPYIVLTSPVEGLFQHSIASGPYVDKVAPDGFNVVTCIEVLEHLYPEDVQRGMNSLYESVQDGGYLVFSSSPYDLEEPTHFSVRDVDWWIDGFEKLGFCLTEYRFGPIPWLFIMQKHEQEN